MTILMTGASGLLGSAIRRALQARGDGVLALVRRTAQSADEIAWQPDIGALDSAAIPPIDAVVHLAGESIAGGRWSSKRKHRIRDSRVRGTDLLAKYLANLPNKPHTLISASATGYYGNRFEETLTEQSPPGSGFLSDVCQAWEKAAQPAVQAGIRTVFPRIGIVLSPDGGALAKMRMPFNLGMGGVIGSGDQYMSWISLTDLTRVILFALDNDTLSGPVNAVSPEPVSNRTFTKALGRVLSRPAFLSLPSSFARLAMGEMADALLLASTRVLPAKLIQSHFEFDHPRLEPALRALMRP
jgi:uncharacterized protein